MLYDMGDATAATWHRCADFKRHARHMACVLRGCCAGLAVILQNATHRSALSVRGTFSWYAAPLQQGLQQCPAFLIRRLPYVRGSACRAAPEILMGGRITQKADIYSLGVLMWEIATQVFASQQCDMLHHSI